MTPRVNASQAEGLQVHSRGQSDESGGARSAAPGEPGFDSPTPQGSYSAALENPTASTLRAAAGTAPTPTTTPAPIPSTPINFTTPPHTGANPLPMDPSHHPTFPPRGLIITADPQNAHPFPPQTPTSLATKILTYEHQHQFSSA